MDFYYEMEAILCVFSNYYFNFDTSNSFIF